METWMSFLVSLLVVCILIGGTYTAYENGMLDPVIEKIGVYMFKAKAKAEEKEMEAKGLQAGEDFLTSQLKGNKQAEDVKAGEGLVGGLKKQL